MKHFYSVFAFSIALAGQSVNAQNVGIGTSTPQTKMHIIDGSSGYSGGYFPGLTFEGSTNRYFNLITPSANESGLLFGNPSAAAHGGIIYNNSSTLSGLQFRTNGNLTRMVIDANGNVGIGITNPAFKLDIADRMRIRSGGGFSSAGLYFNRNDNSNVGGFVGMQDDSHMGFWGNPSGWSITMNTNNGALRINGNEGTAGQALTTTGNGTEWRSPTKAVFDNSVMKVQTNDLSLTSGAGGVEIPNLTHTFTVSSNTKILVEYHYYAYAGSCFACGGTNVYSDLQLDGAFVTRAIQSLGNGTSEPYSGVYFLQVAPGTHTINLVAFSIGPNGGIAGGTWGDKGKLILIMIPE